MGRANVANVHPATECNGQTSVLELAHGLIQETSLGRSKTFFVETQLSLILVSGNSVLVDLITKARVNCLSQLSLTHEKLLAPAVEGPLQVETSSPRESGKSCTLDSNLVVAAFHHPFLHVRKDTLRQLILDCVACSSLVRLQDLLRFFKRVLLEASNGRVDFLVDGVQKETMLASLHV